jgi:beta-lactamase superfamily II metal-dependent hydrolase
MRITLLPSDKGDCLLLEARDDTTILVDGGMPDSYIEHVRPFLGEWHKNTKRPLDLVYVSHIDEDHIGGVLELMNDLVAWRVYHHKVKMRKKWEKPEFLEPPPVTAIWHNAFHDIVEDNAGEIGSMLAARAAVLSNSTREGVEQLAAHYQAIAASIPQAIKLSSRIARGQLDIPLNKEFGGKLAMVRGPRTRIRLNGKKSPIISVLGPFEDELSKFKDKWDKWLEDKKNQAALRRTRDWRDRETDRFTTSEILALDSQELGDRKKVTEENLVSLMLHIEHDGKTILLTGDGHYTDIIRGLKHNQMIKKDDQRLHVDVLKVQHHGSEHNFTAEFAKQITADHYIICGNGRHENPDIRVLDRLLEGRLDAASSPDKGPAIATRFHVWFNCGVKFLKRDIDRRKRAHVPFKEYEKALTHFEAVEKCVAKHAKGGRIKVHYLDTKPLVLDLAFQH